VASITLPGLCKGSGIVMGGAAAYRKGAAFEHEVFNDLSKGASNLVIRSAGSHGLVDIIELDGGQVYIYQCKTNGKISTADWNELYAMTFIHGCIAFLVSKIDGVIVYEQISEYKNPRKKSSRNSKEQTGVLTDKADTG